MAIEDERQEIDRIDSDLVRLLNRRAEIALGLGRAKRAAGVSCCDPVREREVLERVRAASSGPLDGPAMERLFRQVIQESRELEERDAASTGPHPKTGERADPARVRVAFQGERGAFSEEAAVRLLGEDIACIPRPTFESLFSALEEGAADVILAPIENSLAGSVHRCYDLLLESDLRIAGEVVIPIAHHLVGPPGAQLAQVRAVESHPVALAQCERFFAAHPEIRRVVSADTAGSVRDVVRWGDPARAAIGSRRAAQLYGGVVLLEHLEDHAENYTRFLLLRKQPARSEDANKLSLVVRLAHQPGALFRALEPFARRGINLLKIESRPVTGQPWNYLFYLDLATASGQPDAVAALAELRQHTAEFRLLGEYRAAEIAEAAASSAREAQGGRPWSS